MGAWVRVCARVCNGLVGLQGGSLHRVMVIEATPTHWVDDIEGMSVYAHAVGCSRVHRLR